LSPDSVAQPPRSRTADIIALDSVRRHACAAPPDPLFGDGAEPLGALRRASAALSRHAAELDRQADAMMGWRAALERTGRRLAEEGRRARAIAAHAERIGAAIEAGDLDALRGLQDEVARLARESGVCLRAAGRAARAG